MALTCIRCGAPVDRPPPGELARCHFCHTEQDPAVARPGPHAPIQAAPGASRTLLVALATGLLLFAGLVGAVVVLRASARTGETASAPASMAVPASAPAPAPTHAPASASAPEPAGMPCTVTLALDRKGADEGAFDGPLFVGVEPTGFVRVVDKTGRVQRFDDKGTWQSAFLATTTNVAHGPLSSDIGQPGGLGVDARGRVWVTMGYDLVAYDGQTGKPVLKVAHSFPSTCFRQVTIAQTGSMYVRSACTDKAVYAVLELDGSGRILHRFNESADWRADSGDKIAVDASGNLFLAHPSEGQVAKVDRAFKPLTRFGGRGPRLGYFNLGIAPGPLALDGKGRLFVGNGDDIDAYDLEGHPLGRLGHHWGGRAHDLAVGPDGQLWVVLPGDGVVRVQVP